jgi:hypothetical protein
MIFLHRETQSIVSTLFPLDTVFFVVQHPLKLFSKHKLRTFVFSTLQVLAYATAPTIKSETSLFRRYHKNLYDRRDTLILVFVHLLGGDKV